MSNPWAVSSLIPLLAARAAFDHVVAAVRPRTDSNVSQPIPRLRAETLDLQAVMTAGTPVIIQGLAESMSPPVSADLGSLLRIASVNSTPFEVRLFDQAAPYFLYTGDYGQQLLDTRTMTLAEFLGAVFEADSFAGFAVYRQFDRRAAGAAMAEIIDDLALGLEAMVGRPAEKNASGIWIGTRGVVTPLHYDAWPGLLFQTHGSKRILMFSPRDIHRLYFLPQYAVGERWSRLPARSHEADRGQFPLYSGAPRFEATLHSGEALFVPPFWPHEIEALEPNISVPFRFSVDRGGYLHPRFLRPACEVFVKSCLKR